MATRNLVYFVLMEDIDFGTRAVIEALNAGRDVERYSFKKKACQMNCITSSAGARTNGTASVCSSWKTGAGLPTKSSVIAFNADHHYQTEDLLQQVFEQGRTPLVLVLDRVTDVRNFCAIARTAECAGVDFIIIPSRGAAPDKRRCY